jgi:hypothetical protein
MDPILSYSAIKHEQMAEYYNEFLDSTPLNSKVNFTSGFCRLIPYIWSPKINPIIYKSYSNILFTGWLEKLAFTYHFILKL